MEEEKRLKNYILSTDTSLRQNLRALAGGIKTLILHPKSVTASLLEFPIRMQTYGILKATFFEGEYLKLYEAIKPNTILLDLGAFLGDTAVFFALNNNVSKVISYEPSPNTFKVLQKNTRLYRKVELHNEAVMPESGFVKSENLVDGGDTVRMAKEGIKAVSLSSILSEYKGHRIAIKCDIEGAELDLFKTDLTDVYAIEAEYHNGSLSSVVRDLKRRGFTITHIEERALMFAVKH